VPLSAGTPKARPSARAGEVSPNSIEVAAFENASNLRNKKVSLDKSEPLF